MDIEQDELEIIAMLPTKRHETSLVELVVKNLIHNMEQYIPKDEEDVLKKDNLITKILRIFKIAEQKKKKKIILPHHLCNKILETLLTQESWDTNENAFQIHLKFLPNILNSQTKEVNLHSFMSLCPEPLRAGQILNVLRIIAKFAPNIEFLTIGEDPEPKSISKIMMLERKIIFDISRMKKLKMLVILDFVIKFRHLKKICKNLKNLVYVDANVASSHNSYYSITAPEWFDRDFEESFSRLKVFLFRLYSRDGYSYTLDSPNNLTRRCIQLLPSLEIIQHHAYIKTFYQGYFLPMTPPSAPSSLRHLCVLLRNSSFEFDQLAWFPNVTHLLINMYTFTDDPRMITPKEIDALLQFNAHLKSLALLSCPREDILDRFLDSYGKTLHTLSICNVIDRDLKYTFKKIFNACPKLETLVLMGVVMADEESLNSFAQLKNLQWIELAQTKTVNLSNVLRAPKLENFYMFDSSPNLDDIKQVSTLISNKQILSKLKIFRYISHCGPYMDTDSLLGELVKTSQSAFDSLPKLSAFEAFFFKSNFFTENELPLECAIIALDIMKLADNVKILHEGVMLYSHCFTFPSFIV